MAELVDLVGDDLLALVVQLGGLGLDDTGGLLHGRALPDLAGLGDHLVELLTARPGAEHVADADAGNEDQLVTHLDGPFLAVVSILPLWARRRD